MTAVPCFFHDRRHTRYTERESQHAQLPRRDGKMQQWEYLTRFMEASASSKEIKEYIKQHFDKKPRRHSPESMIPELNRLGDEGWELVHMEPVARVGGKEDVRFDSDNWSSTYFCVFKRPRREEAPVPVQQLEQIEQSAYPAQSTADEKPPWEESNAKQPPPPPPGSDYSG